MNLERAEKEFSEELLKRNLIKPYIIKPTKEEIKEFGKTYKYHGLVKICQICNSEFQLWR